MSGDPIANELVDTRVWTEDDVTRVVDGSVVERVRLAELQRRLFGDAVEPVRVSRYIVEQRVGQGSFAAVYRGYDPQLRRAVAIKVLRDRCVQGGLGPADARARLLREAQALARFSHPGVVAVYDVGVLEHPVGSSDGRQLDPGVFIVMEYVHGPTLGRWLKAQRRSVARVLEVCMAAGRGLAAAHDRRIVHRDFKPHNVLLGEDGRVRVADFGLARELDDNTQRTVERGPPTVSADMAATRPGTVLGSPAYMAPEQHRGVEPDAKADQFAFCVTLFEALHGERPFDADSETGLYQAKVSGKITASRNPQVPRALDAALRRGLHGSPQGRFEDMDALLQALQAAASPRRWGLIAGGSAAVAIAIGGAGMLGALAWSSGEVCAAPSPALRDAWTPRTQDSVRSAFEETGVPIATDTYLRVVDRVDRRLRDLQESRLAVCAAQSPEPNVAAEERLCLEQRSLELAELLRLFREADATVVERAVERVDALKPPSSCLSVRGRRGLADQRADTRFAARLARARTLDRAGRSDTAAELLQTVIEEAAREQDRATEGWALLSLGRIHRDARDAEAAIEALERATSIGAAAADDRLVAAAGVELAGVEGTLLRDTDAAAGRVRDTKLAIQRAGAPAELVYRLIGVEAAIAREAGEPSVARDHFLRAMSVASEAGQGEVGSGPWAVHQRTTAINLADTYTVLGDYATAVALLEPVLLELEGELGPHHPWVGRAVQSLAFVTARMDDYGAALTYARRALDIEERLRGSRSLSVGWALNMVGACQLELGLGDQAVTTHARSVSILEETQGERSAFALRARLNLGRARSMTGDLEQAAADVRTALLGLAGHLGEDHHDLAYGYVTLGEIGVQRGDVKAARTAFERALRIRRSSLDADHPQVVMVQEKLEALEGAVD